MGHSYIGTEHLLLALLHEEDGPAARSLRGLGVRLKDAREGVRGLLGFGEMDRSWKALCLAREEASSLSHPALEPEHILLGLFLERWGPAAAVLRSLGVDEERLRGELKKELPTGEVVLPAERIPFSPAAGAVLEEALHQASELWQGSLGTGHLLLGLLRHADSRALRVLRALGLEVDEVRKAVLDEVGWRLRAAAAAEYFGPKPAPPRTLAGAGLLERLGRRLWRWFTR